MGAGPSKHKYSGSRSTQQSAADRPSPPGKPYLLPGSPRSDPDVITIKWAPPVYNGGTKITGYLVEHKRTGSPHWVKATPLMVRHTQLTLSGLEPGMRYQFRVTAENCMGRSEPSQISEPFAISYSRGVAVAPVFIRTLMDTTAIENEKVEFLVQVEGTPTPKISWYKDGFEVFSNRRQRVSTDGDLSSFVIHQASLSDEGEIKCSATNKAGHAVAKARLTLEAPPTIRLPRQYEDGLLFELGEVIRFKISISGRPMPTITWYHNGDMLQPNTRVEMASTERYAMVRISEARREDRGEYQVKAKNSIGDDVASFLVTITDRPLPPGKVAVVMTLGRCVTLSWSTPNDDGGCKIGNYIVEYYRIGWNMWLKAATCRQLTTTIGDLIEGSEYKFRVKAENPYGISDPSEESDVVFIPDPKRGLLEPPARSSQILLDESPDQWLNSIKTPQQVTVETTQKPVKSTQKTTVGTNWPFEEEESPLPSPVILANQVLKKVKLAPKRGWSEDSQPSFDETEPTPPPVPPKRKHKHLTNDKPELPPKMKLGTDKEWDTRELSPTTSPNGEELHSSSEMMLVLVPNSRAETEEREMVEERITAEDLEKEPSVAPPMSLSAPVLGCCEPISIASLRPSVSSSELLHELAMERLNNEADLEEAEMNLRTKYGIERRRSFEKKTLKNREGFLDTIIEKSVSSENIVDTEEESADNKTENYEIIKKMDSEVKTDKELERKSSESKIDEFSERFMQLEKSFKDYSTKYDFDNPSDLESVSDRMSFDYGDETEEETYHPRMPKGTFTPIEIRVPEIIAPTVEVEIPSAPLLNQDESDFSTDNETSRNVEEFTRSNTPSPEIVIMRRSVSRERSPKISAVPNIDQSKLLTPKPILKNRDRSLDRSDQSDTEHSHQKKVRIEAPNDRNDIDRIAREENDIGLTAGEVARQRRMKVQQPKELNDPMNVVISHYSDIVKEYGQPKKAQTKLYLSYEELKAAAEKEELNPPNELIITNKKIDDLNQKETTNLIHPTNKSTSDTITSKKPNLFREYILNLSLFLIACWLYIFNDPLLVIPILILMIYRQVSETIYKKIEYFLKKK
ncbi:hypothetical protein O3M35_001664 [Rhynocoris fuscipes]|uniref:Titin n=1 Tax=Rhynocoris fuscipes TaxID=488301 RepID=A0AAW1CPQ5_9HEMI